MTREVARRQGRRAAMLLLVGLGVAVASGCATKRDLKMLRDEVLALQSRQDSLFRMQDRNYRLLLDTMRASFSMQLDAAGQTSHRFRELEDQLARTEQMITQLQIVVTQLMDRIDRPAATGGGTASVPQSARVPSGGEVADAYQQGMTKMAEGAFTTARSAFEFILEVHPNHPLAPDAQFQIGQTWRSEGQPDSAIAAFEKVEAQWPLSARAPEALLSAGIVAEDQGNRDRARQFYDTLIRRYPATAAAEEARRRRGG